jgi:hypothetical protein
MSRPPRGAALAAFPSFSSLSSSDTLTEAQRRRIREALRGPVGQLAHDVALIQGAIDGPDPEYALFLALEVLRDLAPALAILDQRLAGVAKPAAARPRLALAAVV